MTCETRDKLLIPGKPVKVDRSRVHGDLESPISFELTGKEKHLETSPRNNSIRETIARGGRVFVTENDDYLFVEPSKKK